MLYFTIDIGRDTNSREWRTGKFNRNCRADGSGQDRRGDELAELVGGEIISADSTAVYMGMDIGTAKPTPGEQARAGFHLIDVADPAKPFSVGEFQRLAQESIDDILQRNPPPIVVGGSGLYVRAAIDGLDSSIPAENEDLRNALREDARLHGSEYVHRKLAAVDPESAGRIHPNNLKRVIRALGYESTGEKPSALFDRDAGRALDIRVRIFGLTMNRIAPTPV